LIKSTGDEKIMYKLIITLIVVATMLTACNSNGADKNNQTKESVNHEEWSSFPEYKNIIEQINNKDYSFQTVTDNEGERVLLLIDKNGVEQYKTIFIKNTSRLKIIKINEGQIFNEILDE
jgi:hypothetical protein